MDVVFKVFTSRKPSKISKLSFQSNNQNIHRNDFCFKKIKLGEHLTLLGQGFRCQKNQPLLIYPFRCLRDSQKPKTKIFFQLSKGLFQKIPFLYFLVHKSWIWRTLGHVMDIFSCCHFHNASKECFWSKKPSRELNFFSCFRFL